MKLLMAALALCVAAAPKVAAAIEGKPLELKPKAALVTTAAPSHNYAPFVAPSPVEPDLDLAPHRDAREDQSRSSCNSDRALCYDPGSGHIVYKPARQLMPDLPGM